jgi:hypothetical protein
VSEIGSGVENFETVLKAQTYATFLTPKGFCSSYSTCLAASCAPFCGLSLLLRWKYLFYISLAVSLSIVSVLMVFQDEEVDR